MHMRGPIYTLVELDSVKEGQKNFFKSLHLHVYNAILSKFIAKSESVSGKIDEYDTKGNC